jgi:hypothetical protein
MSYRYPLFTLVAALAFAGAAAQAQPGFNLPAPPAPTDLVKRLLTSLNPRVRLEAAEALGASGDVHAIQALSTAAVYDQNPRVRQAASDALARIRQTAGGGLSVKPRPPAWGALPPGLPGADLPPPPPAAVDPAVELVLTWYQAYLHRSCDPSGLTNWVDLLRRGAPPEQVQACIIGSPEYLAAHGNSIPGFITGMYNDVLQRDPAPQEGDYWLGRLAQLRGNRERAALEFLQAVLPQLHDRPGYGYYPGP